MRAHQIFADLTGRRKRLTNRVLAALAIVSGFVLLALIAALAVSPALPTIDASNKFPASVSPGRSIQKTSIATTFSSSFRSVSGLTAGIKRFAFLVSGDVKSVGSLKRNKDQIDSVLVDWLVISEKGIIENTYRQRDLASDIMRWIKDNAPHISVIPLLLSNARPVELAAMFSGADRRAQLRGQILSALTSANYAGVAIDLPQLPQSSMSDLANFLSDLRKELSTQQKF